MRRLVLRRGPRAHFEAAGDASFNIADTVLATDPLTLISRAADRTGWIETKLKRDPADDVSHLIEFEVRRVDEDVIVRVGDDAWRAHHPDPIRFTFPQLLGTRPVSIGHGEI